MCLQNRANKRVTGKVFHRKDLADTMSRTCVDYIAVSIVMNREELDRQLL